MKNSTFKVINEEIKKLKVILDNLLEEQEVEVFITVLAYGHSGMAGLLLKKSASEKFHRIGVFHGGISDDKFKQNFQERNLVVE